MGWREGNGRMSYGGACVCVCGGREKEKERGLQ